MKRPFTEAEQADLRKMHPIEQGLVDYAEHISEILERLQADLDQPGNIRPDGQFYEYANEDMLKRTARLAAQSAIEIFGLQTATKLRGKVITSIHDAANAPDAEGALRIYRHVVLSLQDTMAEALKLRTRLVDEVIADGLGE